MCRPVVLSSLIALLLVSLPTALSSSPAQGAPPVSRVRPARAARRALPNSPTDTPTDTATGTATDAPAATDTPVLPTETPVPTDTPTPTQVSPPPGTSGCQSYIFPNNLLVCLTADHTTVAGGTIVTLTAWANQPGYFFEIKDMTEEDELNSQALVAYCGPGGQQTTCRGRVFIANGQANYLDSSPHTVPTHSTTHEFYANWGENSESTGAQSQFISVTWTNNGNGGAASPTSTPPSPTPPRPGPTTPVPSATATPLTGPSGKGNPPTPSPCVSQYTGLNICQLKKGDILLETFNFLAGGPTFTLEGLIAGYIGTYWFHAALYDGRGNIVEAAGPEPNPADDVAVDSLVKSSFYYDPNREVSDWVVLRVKPQYESKVDGAVKWAIVKAKDTNALYIADSLPAVPLAFLNPLNKWQDARFYCSLFVWRAFYHQGLDIDFPSTLLRFGIPPSMAALLKQQVSPDDIYASAFGSSAVTTVVQDKNPGFQRWLIILMSHADIRITDAAGNVTGVDPRTGRATNKIPGAFYSGPGREPEWVAIPNVHGPLTVQVRGNGTGVYHLAVQTFGTHKIQGQVSLGHIHPGQVDAFVLSEPQAGPLRIRVMKPTPPTHARRVPLTFSLVPRPVVSGSMVTIRIRTDARAKVTVTLLVAMQKRRFVGKGKHRHQTVRTLVLYRAVVHGTANAHGQLTARLRMTYKPLRPVQAIVTVRAQTPHTSVTRTAVVIIQP
jgi:uncharacterized protein YycO